MLESLERRRARAQASPTSYFRVSFGPSLSSHDNALGYVGSEYIRHGGMHLRGGQREEL